MGASESTIKLEGAEVRLDSAAVSNCFTIIIHYVNNHGHSIVVDSWVHHHGPLTLPQPEGA